MIIDRTFYNVQSLEQFLCELCNPPLRSLIYDIIMETSIYLLAGDSYELELLNKKPAEELRARCGLSWLYETLTSIKNKS